MTSLATQAPPGWERATKGYNRDLSRLVRCIYENRARILESYPMVPIPSDDPKAFTPVAALILAWERWSFMRGQCPDCRGPSLGVMFGGLMVLGSVDGVCTQCGRIVSRHINGFGAAMGGAALSVKGTPYRFAFVGWRWRIPGIPASLVAMLKEIGIRKLPEPSTDTGDERGFEPYPFARGVIECGDSDDLS